MAFSLPFIPGREKVVRMHSMNLPALSKSPGSGGYFKSSPEDFRVREITAQGRVLGEDAQYSPEQLGLERDAQGRFTTFVLQKRDWDTVQLLMRLAKLSGRGRKSVGYAGSKDKRSVSVQLASVFGAAPEQLLSARIRDMKVLGAWRSANGVELGSNLGNSFTAVIRQCAHAENAAGVVEELSGRMPNYYDAQRFGLRMNNHEIGMCIMRGEFDGALSKFLTDTHNERNAASIEARKRLAQEQDYNAALGYFPKGLRNERTVIEYMSRYGNPANALRKLPRGVLLMFVHSVQSMAFNISLAARISAGDFASASGCSANAYGFPDISTATTGSGGFALGCIPGYETEESQMSDYDRQALLELGVNAADFRIKQMPEISAKGSLRPLLAPVRGLSCSVDGENSAVTAQFSIPSGSYATILLGEITKQRGSEDTPG